MSIKADRDNGDRGLRINESYELSLNINACGGQVNHYVRYSGKLYRFVESGVMIYDYIGSNLTEVINSVLEQEYDKFFIRFEELKDVDVCELSENEIMSYVRYLSEGFLWEKES